MEPIIPIIGLVSTVLFAVAIFFLIRYGLKFQKKMKEQFEKLAADYGHHIEKAKIKKAWWSPKVKMNIGKIDGYDSRVYTYTVSTNNSSVTYSVLELQLPFLGDFTAVISKENMLTNALKNIVGEGFVTRDEEFDDSFKIHTNDSLLLKQLFLDEELRAFFMRHKDLIKGNFRFKNGQMRYEEVLTINNDKKREKFKQIIDFSRHLVTALKRQMATESAENTRLEIPESEEQAMKIEQKNKLNRD
jgi:hypothetical protein